MDKLLVVYDTNQIVVFDTINRKLHEWSIENMNKLPANYLRRYNRVIGVVQLSSTKFILWTNYTYAVLDLKLELPAESQILDDHPNNSLQAKHLEADGWFDMLKLTQSKYLKPQQQQTTGVNESTDNLTISNKLKGILAMTYERGTIRVVENPWKQSVAEMPGAFVTKKFN
jgi:hypothetical protein